MRASVYLVVLFLTTLPVHSERRADGFGFQLCRDGSVVVPATINGAGPFRFRVDTGTTRTVVAEEVAARLLLPYESSSLVRTPTGYARRPMAQLETLEFGGLAISRLPVVIHPGTALSSSSRGKIDGLIGQDVLGTLTYTIDYEASMLVLDPRPTATPHVRLPVERVDGLVRLSASQAPGAPPLQLIADSGADGLVLFARGAKLPVSMTPLDTALLRTTSGHKLVRRVRLESLSVGGVSLRDPSAVVVDGDGLDARLGDGLLPLHVFARVTFNGPERYVIVEGFRR